MEVWSEKVRLILPVSASLVLDRLKNKIEKLQEIASELEEMVCVIKNKGGEITEYEEDRLVEIMQKLCVEFDNCITCPARYNCDLGATRTCDQMYNCKACPKLRECFKEWVCKWY